MRGWRIKFVFLLIVYFGGFATAIYTLAPVPENNANASANSSFLRSKTAEEKSPVFSALKSEEFAKSFNTGIHKCIEFSKDAAWRTAKFIKQKIDQRQSRTDS